MADVVVDASALLALLEDEPGAEQVQRTLGSAFISAVNLTEVIAKLTDRGVPERAQRRIRSSLDIAVLPFDEEAAWIAGRLRAATRSYGLSTGDRACLALALHRNVPALTADRAWSRLDVGIEIRVIR